MDWYLCYNQPKELTQGKQRKCWMKVRRFCNMLNHFIITCQSSSWICIGLPTNNAASVTDQIKAYMRTNLVKSFLFSEKIAELMKLFHNDMP